MTNLAPRYKLCDVFGIPLYVDISFGILLISMVISVHSFSYGLTFALILAISIVCHELGHALVARMFGYTARRITLSLLGGCAELIALPRKPHEEFLTALAGPLVSFALSLVGFLVLAFMPISSRYVYTSYWYLMWMNGILGAFNLLPGFPLDGGRIFRSVLLKFFNRAKATLIAMWVGRAVAILLGLYGLHNMFTGDGFGFLPILIAWMIWRQGYLEYLEARMSSSWDHSSFTARVSPPPYGGSGEDCGIDRE